MYTIGIQRCENLNSPIWSSYHASLEVVKVHGPDNGGPLSLILNTNDIFGVCLLWGVAQTPKDIS